MWCECVAIGCFNVAKGAQFPYEYSVEWQSFGSSSSRAVLCIHIRSASYGFNMADDTRKVRVEEQLKIKIGKLCCIFIPL